MLNSSQRFNLIKIGILSTVSYYKVVTMYRDETLKEIDELNSRDLSIEDYFDEIIRLCSCAKLFFYKEAYSREHQNIIDEENHIEKIKIFDSISI